MVASDSVICVRCIPDPLRMPIGAQYVNPCREC